MGKRVLFVGGSPNQTTMMHKIAAALPELEHAYSPLFADGLLRRLAEAGCLDFTTLAGQARRRTLEYLERHGLTLDERGRDGRYDLAIVGTDLVIGRALRGLPLVLVQEGMTDPEDWRYHLVRRLRLPRYLANTSMTGLSHAYGAFCVASDGYRDLFARKGVDPRRMVVTGLPNFDDVASFVANDFPHHGYVLAATSCLRESLKPEDRKAFIRRCLAVADGRELLVKLHPNENATRARREVEKWAPGARVFEEGNTNHMIANCDALVTRYSSVVYVAVALGKEVHSDLPTELLRTLMPIQNGGCSAARIADVCRHLIQ